MPKKLKIVAVSGGLQRPSRTLALVENLLEGLTDAVPADTCLTELGEIVPKFGSALACSPRSNRSCPTSRRPTRCW